MKTSTKQDILKLIAKQEPIGITQIAEHFWISNQIVHRHILWLLESEKIIKNGTPPKVYYFINHGNQTENIAFSAKQKQILEEHFLSITPNGTLQKWEKWFVDRCKQRDLDVHKLIIDYEKIIHKTDSLKKDNKLINTINIFKKQFPEVYIDWLRYCDAYQIQQFGKSKLWNLAFYAKQSQNKKLIQEVIDLTRQQITAFIKAHKIDWICYAPASIRRNPQFMDEVRKWYQIWLPEIKLQKIFASDIIIPQKSIKWTSQRIKNAEQTIFIVWNQPTVKNLLMIDDFVWSGATINICAKKVREKKLAKKIYAISLLGNIDFSYEVISEV